MLEAERDPAGRAVDLEDRNVDVLSPPHDLGGVLDIGPRHLADRQQPVDAAQVHEGAEVREPPDDALAHRSEERRVGKEGRYPRAGDPTVLTKIVAALTNAQA